MKALDLHLTGDLTNDKELFLTIENVDQNENTEDEYIKHDYEDVILNSECNENEKTN